MARPSGLRNRWGRTRLPVVGDWELACEEAMGLALGIHVSSRGGPVEGSEARGEEMLSATV